MILSIHTMPLNGSIDVWYVSVCEKRPHTFAALGVVQTPELCLSLALTALCIGSLHPVVIGLASLMCAWTMRDYSRGSAFVDVTEIFRSCSREKKRRMIKLVAHMVFFVISVFK